MANHALPGLYFGVLRARFLSALLCCSIATGWASAGVFGDGVNLQPSYYADGRPGFGWDLMKRHDKIKTVRIEIEPDKAAQAKDWIAQARGRGYEVIATYHKFSALGSDQASELISAADWWRRHYAGLAASGPFTINLMNEWGSHDLTPAAYANAYNDAIGIVRTVYSGPIIIDVPGWGQETSVAALAVKGRKGAAIQDPKIILSVHVYAGAWNGARGRSLKAADLDDLASAGRPCIIGEFGPGGSGKADWSGIVAHAKKRGWTVLGWAWNGDGGDMNMVAPSWSADPRARSFSPGPYFDTIYSRLGASGK